MIQWLGNVALTVPEAPFLREPGQEGVNQISHHLFHVNKFTLAPFPGPDSLCDFIIVSRSEYPDTGMAISRPGRSRPRGETFVICMH